MTGTDGAPQAVAGAIRIRLVVNGNEVERSVEPRTTLAELLRNQLLLTGTKLSCDVQVCGVCTVLVDRRPVSSCTFLALDADGCAVTTIEGLGTGGELHPLQEAFLEKMASQCGFCTPGFLMMAAALLEENPHPARHEILEYLDGNICRCTGYAPIIEAVESVTSEFA